MPNYRQLAGSATKDASARQALAAEVARATAAEKALADQIEDVQAAGQTYADAAVNAALASANTYTDAKTAALSAQLTAADGQVLADAKAYTDAAVSTPHAFSQVADAAGVVQFEAGASDTVRVAADFGASVRFDPARKQITISAGNAFYYWIHQQTEPAAEWVINHNLVGLPTGITVICDGEIQEPARHIDQTAPFQVRLAFSTPRSGVAYLSCGSPTVQPYHHVQATPSSAWRVQHGLGRVPTAIKVMDAAGNIQEPAMWIDQNAPYDLWLYWTFEATGTVDVT